MGLHHKNFLFLSVLHFSFSVFFLSLSVSPCLRTSFCLSTQVPTLLLFTHPLGEDVGPEQLPQPHQVPPLRFQPLLFRELPHGYPAWAPAPAAGAPIFISLLAHHHIFISSPQVLGSLIFCFGIWILVDKTSFVSFVGEGARAIGEGLPEAGVDPASWGLPCPREPHGAQLPRQVSGLAIPLPTGPCHTSLSLSAFC